MKLKNNWYNAIAGRTSRRAYKHQKIADYKLDQIQDLINDINAESGLHIQFVEDGARLLSGFKASYGMISGRPSLIALVGKAEDPERRQKAGYYGEFLVLECVSQGLGTCWISGTYNRNECIKTIRLKEDEELICVIAVGNVHQSKTLKELAVSQLGKSKQSFDELLAEKDCTPPLWVASGIEAARTAPSAANKKPISYRYQNDLLYVYASKKNHNAEEIDLGISMAHFQLGALQGSKEGVWTKRDKGYLFQ